MSPNKNCKINKNKKVKQFNKSSFLDMFHNQAQPDLTICNHQVGQVESQTTRKCSCSLNGMSIDGNSM